MTTRVPIHVSHPSKRAADDAGIEPAPSIPSGRATPRCDSSTASGSGRTTGTEACAASGALGDGSSARTTPRCSAPTSSTTTKMRTWTGTRTTTRTEKPASRTVGGGESNRRRRPPPRLSSRAFAWRSRPSTSSPTLARRTAVRRCDASSSRSGWGGVRVRCRRRRSRPVRGPPPPRATKGRIVRRTMDPTRNQRSSSGTWS